MRFAAARVLAFTLSAGCAFVACGGSTEMDDASGAKACERGGGVWRSDGCNGRGERCGPNAICEPAIASGCQCDQPNHCWDGTRCVLEPELCPSKANECPTECFAIEAWVTEAENNCTRNVGTIGCWSGMGPGNGAIGCVRDPVDGTEYHTPSTSYVEALIDSGQWSACSGAGYPNTVCP